MYKKYFKKLFKIKERKKEKKKLLLVLSCPVDSAH
jgi:hypothetical protein